MERGFKNFFLPLILGGILWHIGLFRRRVPTWTTTTVTIRTFRELTRAPCLLAVAFYTCLCPSAPFRASNSLLATRLTGRRISRGLLERALELQTLAISTCVRSAITADLGSQLAHVEASFWRRSYLSAAALETWGALDTTHVDQETPPRERLVPDFKR